LQSQINPNENFMNFRIAPILAGTFLISIISFVTGPSAKTKSGLSLIKRELYTGVVTQKKIEQFESILKPVFEKRNGIRSGLTDKLTDNDLIFLAKNWNKLSPSFINLYLSSLSIPSRFSGYSSPGGNFEVYYTTTGDSAVPVADAYGYSQSDWRVKETGANGTPDYVDEVAWALDSSWSMEVERFGFKAPYAYTNSSHQSSAYKVIILKMEGDFDYGMTYPAGDAGQTTGLRSYIELRNEWSSPEWGDYNEYPEVAAHITCAHEFFHSIQYSMGHDDRPSYIDYFPGGWLEGTAVLMEELSFPDVDDYLQYLFGATSYFGDPSLSVFFDNNDAIYTYANSVVALYLYWRAFESPSISFIRRLFFRNEENLQEFSENMTGASVDEGSSWKNILHDFHVNSFFTGTRADTVRFLPDAELMPEWIYDPDTPDENGAVAKTILPYAMSVFAVTPALIDADTMGIRVSSGDDSSGLWVADAILTDTSGNVSVIGTGFKSENEAVVNIPDWRSYKEVAVVVTNADAETELDCIAYFSDSPLANILGQEEYAVYPNPVIRSSHGYLRVRGHDLIDISIYSMDGKLVAHADVWYPDGSKNIVHMPNGFDWKLYSRNGSPVVPGTYVAIIGRKDAGGKLKRDRTSVLVLP
jgi:hypothetical protein